MMFCTLTICLGLPLLLPAPDPKKPNYAPNGWYVFCELAGCDIKQMWGGTWLLETCYTAVTVTNSSRTGGRWRQKSDYRKSDSLLMTQNSGCGGNLGGSQPRALSRRILGSSDGPYRRSKRDCADSLVPVRLIRKLHIPKQRQCSKLNGITHNTKLLQNPSYGLRNIVGSLT